MVRSEAGALRSIEEAILGDAGGSVFWYGRGATALYEACRIAGAGEVIVPALACPSVADAVIAAGGEPRFADVDPDTGLATIDAVKARWSKRTRAVVFIHLYGETADLTELAAWGKRNGAYLIEDAAQALGGRGVGAAGDMVVHSFSRTKIIECGGGALVVRSRVSAEPEVPTACEVSAVELAAMERGDRDLYHGCVALSRLGAGTELATFYRATRSAFAAPLIRTMDDPRPLAEAWPTLREALAARFRKAEIAADRLQGGSFRVLQGWRRSGVCWRLTLLHDAAPAIVEAVRARGFAVSALYWPLSRLYRPDDACPNADRFARRVVNVMIEGHMTEETVRACADAVREEAA